MSERVHVSEKRPSDDEDDDEDDGNDDKYDEEDDEGGEFLLPPSLDDREALSFWARIHDQLGVCRARVAVV